MYYDHQYLAIAGEYFVGKVERPGFVVDDTYIRLLPVKEI